MCFTLQKIGSVFLMNWNLYPLPSNWYFIKTELRGFSRGKWDGELNLIWVQWWMFKLAEPKKAIHECGLGKYKIFTI